MVTFLKCVHQVLRPMPDIVEAVLRLKELRSKSEACRAGRQPARNLFGRYAADRKYFDVLGEDGAQGPQMLRTIAARRKEL